MKIHFTAIFSRKYVFQVISKVLLSWPIRGTLHHPKSHAVCLRSRETFFVSCGIFNILITDIFVQQPHLRANEYTFKGGYSIKTVFRPSEMGSTQKGKNLLPLGSKFFPFSVDPFSEGPWCAGKQKRKSQKLSPLLK